MRIKLLSSAVLLCVLSGGIQAAELKTLEQKASYSFGIDIYNNLKTQGMELEIGAFTQGLKDAASGKDPKLGEQQRTQAKLQMQQAIREKMMEENKAIAEKNQKEGDAFLKANSKKEGVKVTDSGLQYKVIKAGSGKTPSANDTVVTHYRGTLIDGREFDSSYKRKKPATFPVKGVIKGWTEALQLMQEGAKWQLFIPAELAYGNAKRSELITPNSTLVFDIELLEIK